MLPGLVDKIRCAVESAGGREKFFYDESLLFQEILDLLWVVVMSDRNKIPIHNEFFQFFSLAGFFSFFEKENHGSEKYGEDFGEEFPRLLGCPDQCLPDDLVKKSDFCFCIDR
jgi:hypothetical protein